METDHWMTYLPTYEPPDDGPSRQLARTYRPGVLNGLDPVLADQLVAHLLRQLHPDIPQPPPDITFREMNSLLRFVLEKLQTPTHNSND